MLHITHDQTGKVTAYSEAARHPNDLKEGEIQVEVDLDWQHIDCKKHGLTFIDGVLFNGEIEIAKAIPRPDPEEEDEDDEDVEDS